MKRFSTLVRATLALVALFALVFMSTGNASAATRNKDNGTKERAQLSKAYHREVGQLGREEKALDQAHKRAARVQDMIVRLKARNKPTADLEKALDQFQASIKGATATHETTKDILTAHQGFNDLGEVTDLPLARDTVRNARQQLDATRKTLHDANQDLTAALRKYRGK